MGLRVLGLFSPDLFHRRVQGFWVSGAVLGLVAGGGWHIRYVHPNPDLNPRPPKHHNLKLSTPVHQDQKPENSEERIQAQNPPQTGALIVRVGFFTFLVLETKSLPPSSTPRAPLISARAKAALHVTRIHFRPPPS